MTLVFNASPLIVLAKARLLGTFIGLGEGVMIPAPVADEIMQFHDPTDPARAWLGSDRAAGLVCPAPDTPSFIAAWDLGAGESAVLSLARATSAAVAVIDDLAARRCAQALNQPMIGTLGMVLLAKREGILTSASDALDAIVAAGLYISPEHLARVRAAAGE